MTSKKSSDAKPDPASSEIMPPGMRYGYQFGFFNAVNFQIATGTPLVLFAKSLGASSTVLGILASLLPLFAFLQLPATGYLPRFGYKKFLLGGWGLRTIMVFALSAVPLLSFIDAPTKIALVLILLVIFSVLRGVSVGVWWPWITELLPVSKRGEYLSREQLAVHLGSLVALGISAVVLQLIPPPVSYAAIFFLAATAGVTSLFAVKKVPDVPATEATRQSSTPVPWKAIVAYPPFRRLLFFGALWAVATGGFGTFTAAFTREALHFPDSSVVYLSLFIFAGAIATLPFTARLLVAAGTKNTLRLGSFLTVAVTLGWLLLAARIWPPDWKLVAALNLAFGVATANFAVASTSLAMSVMPIMGRNHFYALHTVATSLATALAPIIFGMLLDALRDVSGSVGVWSINRYSLYFLLAAALLSATTFTVSLLLHAEAQNAAQEDFSIYVRLRRLIRLLQR